MKRILSTTFFLFFAINVVAQAPQKMSYQAVIRNSSDALVSNTVVGMRITILQGSAAGTPVYVETQTPSTNLNGLISIEIGSGTIVTGTMGGINWSSGAYFIKTETDVTGGTNYSISGTSQLMSVPFALYAASSGNLATTGANVGDMQYWSGTSWINVPIGQPGQVLQINALNIPEWSGSAFPTLTTTPIPPQITDNYIQAVCGGTITNDGANSPQYSSGLITVRGVCWSTTPNPTTVNFKQTNVIRNGNSFTATMSGLVPGTTYYVRAFATNNEVTGYGNEIVLSVPGLTLPIVTTEPISSPTAGNYAGGGQILFQGGAAITQRGLCWSTTPNPTITDYRSELGLGDVVFTSILPLEINTTYYIRAYATNSVGTGYGNEVSYTSSSVFTVGSFFQGGIVAYILQLGDPGYIAGETHGFITTTTDYGLAKWGCDGISGAVGTQTTLGSGNLNTNNIVNYFSPCSSTLAANICSNLVLNGYSDWYLPSLDELVKIFANRTQIGGFTEGYYWTSSRSFSSYGAVAVAVDNPQGVGEQYFTLSKGVRPIRSF